MLRTASSSDLPSFNFDDVSFLPVGRFLLNNIIYKFVVLCYKFHGSFVPEEVPKK